MKIEVKVIPNSSKESVEKQEDGSYRVHVKEKPVKGKANEAVKRLLANHFNLNSSFIEMSQTTSRKKIVEIKYINA